MFSRWCLNEIIREVRGKGAFSDGLMKGILVKGRSGEGEESLILIRYVFF